MYTERLLPFDTEAEEAVIGSILIDSDSLSKVTSYIKPEDFYISKNQSCYLSCISLFEKSEPINQITLSHELSSHDLLEDIGGTEYLAYLVESVPTSIHIEHYARIVQKTSTMRKLISTATEIADIGYNGVSDVESSLNKAEKLLFGIRSEQSVGDFVHIRSVLDTYMEETAALDSDSTKISSTIPTGFPDIDKIFGGGLQPSDMIVVAARPSLGKSTLAFNIAQNAASLQGLKVGIFSLEMSAEQIAMRLLSSQSGVDSHRLRINLISSAEETKVIDSIGQLSELPIYIDDTPIQSVSEMIGKAKRMQSETGIDLIIVDYLQLITGSRANSRQSENRVQEMGEISRSLKGMARDLNVPVLACSQLSRAVEQRPSHRPILSDLRESGSIEQDADIVSFIYREDVYTTESEWERKNPNDQYPANIAEIIVAKHRNGPTGTIPLYFRNDVVTFESLDTRPERISTDS
ncbi:MAG: replicative DNA helicase [SAR202 cluster bacterium]|nr:replicative DNA helicase [SAR202 cluster bacterium]|tara:strand:+ start:60592 stop:61986 length:1395 start_codon:yes stop_codon:yes gene_type:complete